MCATSVHSTSKKKDRGQKIDISSVHKFANEINIKIKYPENWKKKEIEKIEKT